MIYQVRAAPGGFPRWLSWQRPRPPCREAPVTTGQTVDCQGKASLFPLICSLLSLRQWHFYHLESLSEYDCPESLGNLEWKINFWGDWTTMSRMLFSCSITNPTPGDAGDHVLCLHLCLADTRVSRMSRLLSRGQFYSRWCPCLSRVASLLAFACACSSSQLLAPAGFAGVSFHWWNSLCHLLNTLLSSWNACLQERLSSNIWGMLKDKNCSALVPCVRCSKVEKLIGASPASPVGLYFITLLSICPMTTLETPFSYNSGCPPHKGDIEEATGHPPLGLNVN